MGETCDIIPQVLNNTFQLKHSRKMDFSSFICCKNDQTFLEYHRFYELKKGWQKIKIDQILPPKSEAAVQHSYLVQNQVELWLGNIMFDPQKRD